MITKTFRDAIVARLESDAYFTQANEVTVRPEQSGFNTKKAIQDALNARGMLVVVSYCKFQRDFRKTNNEFILFCDLTVYENPKQNATNDGDSGRDGESCLGKAIALFHNYTIQFSRNGSRVDPFGKLQIVPQPGSDGVGYLGERDFGVPAFGLRVQSNTAFDIESLVLGDPNSPFILVTENNQPLSVSPVDP